ncbi:MAG TPA: hemolysin family protein [Chryseolinea sp.]|nr:hemolysin family protein [Chryseolinea sp.]
MDSILLSWTIIFLILSFLFSLVEISYLAVNRLQIDASRTDGLSSRILLFFIQRPSWLITTTRVGYIASLVLFTLFIARLMRPVAIDILPQVLQHTLTLVFFPILLTTLLALFTAYFLPKSIANINPQRMLTITAIPFGLLFIVLFLVVYVVKSLSRFIIVHILRVEYHEEKPVFGLIDLSQYFTNFYNVKPENGELQIDEKILHNALEFKTVKIRECMIPRTEITAVDITASVEKLRQTFVETGHSKVIIYKDSLDDVVGYCHSSSLFKMPSKIEDILTPIIIVPEATLANELMIRFINEKNSLAVVIDEFGGTAGIVSREDVIEEIFGEIEDEHDEDDLIEQKLDESTYLFSARLEIDYLNEKYNWKLPIGEYETLSGLILSYTEDFPRPGDTITIGPFIFTIQATQNNRIDTIKVSLKETI